MTLIRLILALLIPQECHMCWNYIYICHIELISTHSSLRREHWNFSSPGKKLAPVIARLFFWIFKSRWKFHICKWDGRIRHSQPVFWNLLLLLCINYFTIHCMLMKQLSTCEGSVLPLYSAHPVSINWLWLWCRTTVTLNDVEGSERENKS